MNKQKEFHEWLRKTFTWVDNDAKKLMYRAWCARGASDRKEAKEYFLSNSRIEYEQLQSK